MSNYYCRLALCSGYQNELMHKGKDGMHWGVRHYQPYTAGYQSQNGGIYVGPRTGKKGGRLFGGLFGKAKNSSIGKGASQAVSDLSKKGFSKTMQDGFSVLRDAFGPDIKKSVDSIRSKAGDAATSVGARLLSSYLGSGDSSKSKYRAGTQSAIGSRLYDPGKRKVDDMFEYDKWSKAGGYASGRVRETRDWESVKRLMSALTDYSTPAGDRMNREFHGDFSKSRTARKQDIITPRQAIEGAKRSLREFGVDLGKGIDSLKSKSGNAASSIGASFLSMYLGSGDSKKSKYGAGLSSIIGSNKLGSKFLEEINQPTSRKSNSFFTSGFAQLQPIRQYPSGSNNGSRYWGGEGWGSTNKSKGGRERALSRALESRYVNGRWDADGDYFSPYEKTLRKASGYSTNPGVISDAKKLINQLTDMSGNRTMDSIMAERSRKDLRGGLGGSLGVKNKGSIWF